MATLSKIRSHGPLLVAIIAVALFCFVAGDLFKGCEGVMNQSRQEVGEIKGDAVSYTDFNKYVSSLKIAIEVNGQQATEEQIRDYAWQRFVQNKLFGEECEKLGIMVTDKEVNDILQNGQSEWLRYFYDEKGVYNSTARQEIIKAYEANKDNGNMNENLQKAYEYCIFLPTLIREDALANKYGVLLSASITTTTDEAQQAFDEENQQSDILVAQVPFSSIEDKDVTVTDEDVKAKYEEMKEYFYKDYETRDLKYISVQVLPSEADKAESLKAVQEVQKSLEQATTNEAAGNIVRQALTTVAYSDIPKSKNAYPTMIANMLDSMAVGATAKAEFDVATNSYYTFKLLDKTTQADSVLCRILHAVDQDATKVQQRADSIVNAINAGGDVKAIAKTYQQSSDSVWITTAEIERGEIEAEAANLYNILFTTPAGTVKQVKMADEHIIIAQVLESKAPITKYNVACAVKASTFSDKTYNDEYNRFNSFLAANKTIESIEANAAKEGYQVLPLDNVSSATHGIANIQHTSQALRWAFDEAEAGNVSTMYQCGQNDNLLVVAVTGVNETNYIPQDKVADQLKIQVTNDKKAEKILAQLKGATSLSATSKFKDAQIDSVQNVTFANAVSQDPIVGALAAKTAKGAVSNAAKGTSGVYMVQVLDKKASDQKFDAKTQKLTVSSNIARYLQYTLINTLSQNAEIKDNRYKFYE